MPTKTSQNRLCFNYSGKVNFCTGTGRKAFFRIFFGLILDPPPVHMLLQRKKANSFVPAIFSPLHGLFRKKGGTGTVYVFLFPAILTSRVSRDPPDYGKERRFRPLSREILENLEILEISPVKRPLDTPLARLLIGQGFA